MSACDRRLKRLANHLKASKNAILSRAECSSDVPERVIEVEEIEAARENGETWIAIKGLVYDVTDFLEEHPGGEELITDIPATDIESMTIEFDDAEHSEEAFEELEEYLIGRLGGANVPIEEEEVWEMGVQGNVNAPFADKSLVELRLIDQASLSRDVCVYRFELPNADDVFGLPIGKHIMLSFEDDLEGKTVSRAYTPVSPYGEVGFVDFLIKSYPSGKMSNHLKSMEVGTSTIRMRGPKGKLSYLGDSTFSIRRHGEDVLEKATNVGMICGGSGITPMFQILQKVFKDPTDSVKISVLFANKTIDDVVLKEALDEFNLDPRIAIHYTLDSPPTNWKQYKGFITKQMLAETMPPPGSGSKILLCGPPPMIKKACLPALEALGYAKDDVFKF